MKKSLTGYTWDNWDKLFIHTLISLDWKKTKEGIRTPMIFKYKKDAVQTCRKESTFKKIRITIEEI